MTARTIVAVLALAAMGAAAAAEITLYEHAKFAGARLTLRGVTRDLAGTGLNDRVSSVVVTSGRWELCTEAEFRGNCAVFGRGEYPVLDGGLNDRISSVREAGNDGDRRDGDHDRADRGRDRDRHRGAIELFDQTGFAGRSIKLDDDAPALGRAGFNDRAASIDVLRGTWELCADAEYSGNCRTFAPGRYADLGRGLARQVSSARLLRRGGDVPRPVESNVPPPTLMPPEDVALEFFSEPGFRGERIRIDREMRDLERLEFNDRAASVVVLGGTWELCTDARFGGNCAVYRPGRYPELGGISRQISSVRRVR